jgi:hypothetical protein
MKKIFLLATAAFLFTGVSFAHNGGDKKQMKDCCKDSKTCKKECCKKDDKKDSKAAAKTTAKASVKA